MRKIPNKVHSRENETRFAVVEVIIVAARLRGSGQSQGSPHACVGRDALRFSAQVSGT